MALSIWIVVGWLALGGADLILDPRVEAEESARVAVIERITPAVLTVFPQGIEGGGSGVLISADGLALTNHHVVGGAPWCRCALGHGMVVDAVLVGFDPVGDLALLQLIGSAPFPFVELGESDAVRVGQAVLAAGNPFLLATDFTPTFTRGIISGVHRYQGPIGGILEYTDCLQTDASVNPGNSGGPLFDEAGRVIGINGRISPDKRGRVNVGVAYALTTRQIENFLEHLRAGREATHASLGGLVETAPDGRAVLNRLAPESDAYRQGMRDGDELVSFAGRTIASTNDYLNILGTLPGGWSVPIEWRRDNAHVFARVRLEDLTVPESALKVRPLPPHAPAGVRERFAPRAGWANGWAQDRARAELIDSLRQDLVGIAGRRTWTLHLRDEQNRALEVRLSDTESVLRREGDEPVTRVPRAREDGSGVGAAALLELIESSRLFLLDGPGSVGSVELAGGFPDRRHVVRPVLRVQEEGFETRWYVDRAAKSLAGVESISSGGADRAAITWSGELLVEGVRWPSLWEMRVGEMHYGRATLESVEVTP